MSLSLFVTDVIPYSRLHNLNVPHEEPKEPTPEITDTVTMKASTPTSIRQLVIENKSRRNLDSLILRPLENIALRNVPQEHSRQEIPKPIIFPTLTRAPSTSTAITLTTQIPERFEWIRVSSTREERKDFRMWVYTTDVHREDPEEWERLLDYKEFLYTPIVDHPDPDEDDRFLDWQLSTSREVPNDFKRLKWTHSTATTYDTSPDERKRWSLQEEILKPLETALEHIQSYIKHGDSYPHLKQEHTVYTTVKGMYGLYECRNAFWVWTKLLNCPGIPLDEIRKGPVFVGEKIKAVYLESDMIQETPSINELGVVTIKLSGRWIARCIHKMLKDGIETWAPRLPVKRVIVDYPSLDEEMHVDLFRRCSIRNTLMSILEYSKVDVTISRCSILPTFSEKKRDGMFDQQVLDKWFPYEEIEGYVLIKGQVPFILPKRDFESAYKDIFALWNGLCEHSADWIIYLTPVRQQAYIEMCFAAAKLEGWIPSDRHKPPRASYAGYQACTTVLDDNLLEKAKARCVVVEQGEAAKLLGYTAEVVLDCVFRYTSLKNHRLAVCTFDIEMLNEEGNTFVYLLNTHAKIRKITDDYHKDISELKKASDLILENDEGWEEGVERILGSHLLEFTEVLEESCSSVLPHILCEYLYDLAKKFNRYHSCVCKDGYVAASSTLLLYEATSVVMEKCFHLLGITATSSVFALSIAQLPSRLLSSVVERPLDAKVRLPYRNCRFELLSFRTRPQASYVYVDDAKLHGLISASDKHGMLSVVGSHFFEPDFAHVPLFNYDCHEAINMISGYGVYLAHSTSHHSIPFTSFSSFIELYMELYVTKKQECHQVCNDRKAIDLSELWEMKSDGACGCLSVNVEEGFTSLYYILLKDAVDTAIDVNFRTKSDTLCLKVSGYIFAYYGDDYLEECQSESEYMNKDCFYALLFLPKSAYYLKASQIPLIQSVLAVPTKGSLIIKAYVEDYHSREVIMNGSCKFKPQLGNCSSGTINGTEGCSLEVKVKWNYQGRYI